MAWSNPLQPPSVPETPSSGPGGPPAATEKVIQGAQPATHLGGLTSKDAPTSLDPGNPEELAIYGYLTP